jgi:hypothetical protein
MWTPCVYMVAGVVRMVWDLGPLQGPLKGCCCEGLHVPAAIKHLHVVKQENVLVV